MADAPAPNPPAPDPATPDAVFLTWDGVTLGLAAVHPATLMPACHPATAGVVVVPGHCTAGPRTGRVTG